MGLAHRKIRTRYARVLKTATWSEEELRELGGNLARLTRGWAQQKTQIEARLAWDGVAYLATLGYDAEAFELPDEAETD